MKAQMKKIAVGNMGEEELERMQRTVLTRDETRAEADVLFGGAAKDMRKADRRLLEKLFVQTPGSLTMAPNLQKEASVKLASMLACGPDGQDGWLAQFEGTNLLQQAIHLEEQSLQCEQEDIQSRIEDQTRYSQQDQERNARWQKRDQVMMQKRVLALELAKEKAGLGAQQEQPAPEGEEPPPEEMEAAPQEEKAPPPQAAPEGQKTASVTKNVDAFFEKLSAPTDAQRRYPELLKVADSDTKKAISLKPKATTEISGPTPVRSSLSDGSA